MNAVMPAVGGTDPGAEPGDRTRVIEVMGTVVSIDVRDATVPTGLLDRVERWFRDVDGRFSPFHAESEISRISDGRLLEGDAHPDVQAILRIADALAELTDHAFDARRWRPDGRLDPSGVVKGWSVQAAADQMTAAGVAAFAINAGGDVVVRGGPRPGTPWRVGIRHPDRPERIAAVLRRADGAVATSAAYERGPHIVDPRTRRSPATVRSVTVIGPDLTWADAYSTTGFVLGMDVLEWIADRPGYDAFVIGPDGRASWTEGVDRALVR